jgi:leucyl/phenylalanyl-tRNA--protein transferase
VIRWLRPSDPPEAFPPVTQALREPDGLLCAGGDLSPQRLLAAYRRGIFPWFNAGQPILWWSPDPRMVLVPQDFKVSRSLAKSVRNRGYRVTSNTAFAEVIARCAESGGRATGGTWITDAMREAYLELHRLGHAQSVEVWQGAEPGGDGGETLGEPRLVGGLYGIRLGRMFFGESMFSTATDASKVALHWLATQAAALGIELIDCQMATSHLASLGARAISRGEFLAWLERTLPAGG